MHTFCNQCSHEHCDSCLVDHSNNGIELWPISPGPKLLTCGYCPKTFTRGSQKRDHMRTHFEDRSFACERCWKTFTRASDCRRHEKIHARKDDTTVQSHRGTETEHRQEQPIQPQSDLEEQPKSTKNSGDSKKTVKKLENSKKSDKGNVRRIEYTLITCVSYPGYYL